MPLAVLVVDDNRDAADALGQLLRLWGHEPVVAYDGPPALELARGHRPDLALVDLSLPSMDGCDLGAQLRRLPGLERLGLVALTGVNPGLRHQRAHDCGFAAVLLKPVEPGELRTLVGAFASLKADAATAASR
jgi:CheY-like chemotaxis protein